MSKNRQEPERNVMIRTYGLSLATGSLRLPQTLEWDQLIYASQGVITVNTSRGSWVVPPQRAVWVPAGIEHRIEMSGLVSLRTLYLRKGLCRGLGSDCRVAGISPLLRELILHTTNHGALNRRKPAQARLIGVILDQLAAIDAMPLWLPMPGDPRARELANQLMKDPGLAIRGVLRKIGAGKRTMERIFQRETKLSLGRWRQQLRLLHALRLLAAGESVTNVALSAGYESTSAFIAMFRKSFGKTPGRYYARGAERSARTGG